MNVMLNGCLGRCTSMMRQAFAVCCSWECRRAGMSTRRPCSRRVDMGSAEGAVGREESKFSAA